ncbi:ATP synthase subunit a [Pedobacter sp. Bi27]|uniref:F0F1 ATP synthase subunit A n=1 Tax=unclassified Pedobacter TaxID=2628915 RepID=UPI001DDDC8CE|nr:MULTISPECIES: F0F1 ATP synthase subunit A [unclassified Pedobacter]CAH0222957.1 ATP synthase subunit a [Pedobacter sp. Bi27]CAH0236156.1 ATP synthase subunit a [Pedobacter sp. Bi36]CAH0262712.1 ATP synthase subunit a [Pedobacter sp. Bi126]
MDCNQVFVSKVKRLIVVFTLLIAFLSIKIDTFAQVDSAVVPVDSVVAGSAEAVSGEHGAAKHGEEKFEPTKVIMEHIADSHMWHLWGHTSLPLPVILYTANGLEVFSSGNFHHGEHDYNGKYNNYRLEEDHIKVVGADGKIDEEASKSVLDFSITKNVAAMFVAILIILIVFISVARAYKKRVGKAPKGLQSLIEPIIVFVRDDIAKPNIGHKYAKFMPYLLTVFFFIWFNNLLGLIPIFPGGANVTGNIALTFVMALGTMIIVNINGNKYYWKHILTPDVPWWLYPIMIPVELIGIISKPFALMIRLFANITAGHIIVLSLISLIFIFETAWISPVSVAFVIFMDVLELLVAFLQAFIFTLLTALFIGMAVEEHH